MSPATEQLLRAAMTLPEDEQWELVEALLVANSPTETPSLDPAWLAEIERRSAEVDAGSVTLTPWSIVRERVRRGVEERSRG